MLTIRYVSKAGEFRGVLKSSAQECVAGRVKVLKQAPGKDKTAGSAKVPSSGRWSVGEPHADGRYYAKVAQRPTAAGACPAARSKVKRVR